MLLCFMHSRFHSNQQPTAKKFRCGTNLDCRCDWEVCLRLINFLIFVQLQLEALWFEFEFESFTLLTYIPPVSISFAEETIF
jgi:hypothetical protein